MAKNQNLQTLLNHDELTQLYTRAYITESFHKNLDLSTPAFLIMADVDNFKHINDTYGHPCGDYVLFTLSTIMKTVCPAEAKISRWGGEEFVILLYNQSKEDVISSIEKLRESIASYHFNFMGNEFSVTATFGISGTEESTSFDELVLLADNRMYYGKNSGKNTVISFS